MTPFVPGQSHSPSLLREIERVIEMDLTFHALDLDIKREQSWRESAYHSSKMEGEEITTGYLQDDNPDHGPDLLARALYGAYRSFEPQKGTEYLPSSILQAQTLWLGQRHPWNQHLGIGFRGIDVQVGHHVAPAFNNVESCLKKLGDSQRFYPSTAGALLCLFSLHHRLLYVHPFADGNGRISRLVLEKGLVANGLSGAWSLSKILHRQHDEYLRHLSNADRPRQGDYDGRGALTECGLVAWIRFLTECCLEAMSQTEASQ